MNTGHCGRGVQQGAHSCLGRVRLPDLLRLLQVQLRLLEVAWVCAGALEGQAQRQVHLPKLHQGHTPVRAYSHEHTLYHHL